MWERFSYYGMRALLILFMTAPLAAGGLGFDTAKAGAIYGTYVSLVYITSLPGGWLADRFLGQRRATLYGGVLIMLGHICLAVPSLTTFYLGLGSGDRSAPVCSSPTSARMVGELYTPDDERRDAGFSLYYMGINTGAFIAPLVCGWFAQSEQFRGILGSMGIAPESAWHWGFAMAAVGMFFGLVQYLAGWKHLGTAGMYPAPPESPEAAAAQRRLLRLGLAACHRRRARCCGCSPRTGVVRITAQGVSNALGVVLLLTTVAFFVWMFIAGKWTPEERKRLVVVLVLFVAALDLLVGVRAGGLHAQPLRPAGHPHRGVRLAVPAELAPVGRAVLPRGLRRRCSPGSGSGSGTRDPSSPTKFTIGLVCVSLSFAILVIPGAAGAAGHPGEPALAGRHLSAAHDRASCA